MLKPLNISTAVIQLMENYVRALAEEVAVVTDRENGEVALVIEDSYGNSIKTFSIRELEEEYHIKIFIKSYKPLTIYVLKKVEVQKMSRGNNRDTPILSWCKSVYKRLTSRLERELKEEREERDAIKIDASNETIKRLPQILEV